MDVRKEAEGRRGLGARDVTRLLRQLDDADTVAREAAVARLRVIGPQAFSALVRLAESVAASTTARAGALAALDSLDDVRVVPVAQRALTDTSPEVAQAAIGVLRGWLNHAEGLPAIESLTIVALDRQCPNETRLAALDALSDLPAHLVAPVRATSALDPGPPPSDTPGSSLEWLSTYAQTASLTAVHDLLSEAREAERVAASDRERDDWCRVRGAAHLVLAHRGSRLAVYDLRETFGAARRPLPLDFLTAFVTVGDESCLEPAARAWAASTAEPWWQARLADAVTEVVGRLGLGVRHASVKRLRQACPTFPLLVATTTRPAQGAPRGRRQ